MNRHIDGSYRLDPTPAVHIFVNKNDEISLEVDDMIVSIPHQIADGIANALRELAIEIGNGDWAEKEDGSLNNKESE